MKQRRNASVHITQAPNTEFCKHEKSLCSARVQRAACKVLRFFVRVTDIAQEENCLTVHTGNLECYTADQT